MTKYKVVNYLFNTEDGKTLRIESVYDSFEHVADKLIKDLNSVWKGVVPFPLKFEIFEVSDDAKGISYYEDDKLITHNDDMIEGVMERYGYAMTKEIPKQKDALEKDAKAQLSTMVDLLKKVNQ
jgi:hypothetical protein